MINTLAISNYRSILDVKAPMSSLNVITGANGTGKSNLYKSLRLLSRTVSDDLISALAAEGGLDSVFWAGPEIITSRMKSGEVPVQGGPHKNPKRLRFGFATDEYSYLIELGTPMPSLSMFSRDPEIKRELIWAGSKYHPSSVLVDRDGPVVKVREGRGFKVMHQHQPAYQTLFSEIGISDDAPEIAAVRNFMAKWRFYDHFRTDAQAPARMKHLGTRSPVLSESGANLAAALQTIIEIGDHEALADAVDDAFPGTSLHVSTNDEGRFYVSLQQPSMLRAIGTDELSDGTLRYLLLVAALLTPRPPALMVLNEPETSLHPDLLAPLARLIKKASDQTQVWVVSHAARLIAELKENGADPITLYRPMGETKIMGLDEWDEPSWKWATNNR